MASVSVAELGGAGVSRGQSLWRYWRGPLRGSEFVWALAFLVPYIGVFLAFVIYPVVYGLLMGSKPALYPASLLPVLRTFDSVLSHLPRLFAARCLVMMQKTSALHQKQS